MSESSDNWYRLDVLLEEDRAIDAVTMLWELDAAGVEIQDRETYIEDDSMPPVPEGTNRLVAYFQRPDLEAAGELEQEIVNQLTRAELVPLSIRCEHYTDRSWETSWKDYFKPAQIAPRVTVGPPWEDFDAPEDGTKIVIEPGMAFGTGTHETTQLCAEKIDRMLLEAGEPLTVLDVGCGSAILSMIARRLGAARVVGVDVDETAVEVARENLKVNDLAGQIELSTTPADEIDEQFDVVIANILTHILLFLREALQARVAPDGVLLLSGITEEQTDEIREAFGGEGWVESGFDQKGEWVSFEFRREQT